MTYIRVPLVATLLVATTVAIILVFGSDAVGAHRCPTEQGRTLYVTWNRTHNADIASVVIPVDTSIRLTAHPCHGGRTHKSAKIRFEIISGEGLVYGQPDVTGVGGLSVDIRDNNHAGTDFNGLRGQITAEYDCPPVPASAQVRATWMVGKSGPVSRTLNVVCVAP